MNERVLIIPKDGLRIKDPVTLMPLPPEGKIVLKSVYWMRRAKAGDVIIEPEKAVSKPKENIKEDFEI